MSNLLKDELRDIAFREIYQRLQEPKGRRKAYAILEATVQCIAKVGFEKLTLERIAREAGVSRPMVKYYFKDLDDISECAVKYIRVVLQKYVVEAVNSGDNELESFNLYIDCLFKWFDQFRTHSKAWVAFFWHATHNPRFRHLHSVAASKAHERLKHLLESGRTNGYFEFEDGATAAKNLEIALNGMLIFQLCENHEDNPKIRKQIRQMCLQIVGAKTEAQLPASKIARPEAARVLFI